MSTIDPPPGLGGRLSAGAHFLPVRVYFEDTDFSGVVYHGSYVRFLERGRTEFLRAIGIGHGPLKKGAHGESLAFAVRHLALDFLKPARMDDVVEVETRAEELTGARGILAQTIRRGGEVLVTAIVTVVLINDSGRARRWPDSIRETILRAGNLP